MELTQLNIIIGNVVRFDCEIKLLTCYTKTAGFCLPEGIAMAHNSYTMSTRGLPDMYTLSPRASGVHIRQAGHSCPYARYSYNLTSAVQHTNIAT